MNNGRRQFAWLTPEGKFYRGSKPMENDEQMQMAVKHHWKDACYQSVYAFDEWKDGRPIAESAIIDRVFFDFDADGEIHKAIDDAAKLARSSTTQWFSGKKGVGMLLHFDAVNLHPSMKKPVLKTFSNMVIENLDLQTADHAVIGDLMRVHRIPNTRHQDTGLYAIPLDIDMLRFTTIAELKERAKDRRDLITRVHHDRGLTERFMQVEQSLIRERMRYFADKNILSEQFYAEHYYTDGKDRDDAVKMLEKLDEEERRIQAKHVPKVGGENRWITEAATTLLTYGQLTNGRDRGAEHKARVHFCKYAHECGWTFKQICEAFISIVDRNGKRCYDKKMTEDQVRSCIGRR